MQCNLVTNLVLKQNLNKHMLVLNLSTAENLIANVILLS